MSMKWNENRRNVNKNSESFSILIFATQTRSQLSSQWCFLYPGKFHYRKANNVFTLLEYMISFFLCFIHPNENAYIHCGWSQSEMNVRKNVIVFYILRVSMVSISNLLLFLFSFNALTIRRSYIMLLDFYLSALCAHRCNSWSFGLFVRSFRLFFFAIIAFSRFVPISTHQVLISTN